MNRYHNPGTGRFMTPDPYMNSAGPTDPGSWNRYAYTRGDPVNRIDLNGTCDSTIDGIAEASCGYEGDPLSNFCVWGFVEAGDDTSGCPGGGPSYVPLGNSVTALPPCFDDVSKIRETLNMIGNDILQTGIAKGTLNTSQAAALQNSIQGDINSEVIAIEDYIYNTGGGTPDPTYYLGGHFNLFLTTDQLTAALGVPYQNSPFQNYFAPNGFVARLNKGRRTNEPDGWVLHSQYDRDDAADQFHLDQYNSYNPLHLGVDVIFGNIGSSPCLDPPWQQ
jgi:hypothetical protein